MALKERSPVAVLLYSIFTCGIYYLYWIIVTTNEIEASLQQKDGSCSSGGTTILLSIVTCGLYLFFWAIKQGERIHRLGDENGVPVANNGAMYLVLLIFASPIAALLIQSDLNNIIIGSRQ